MKNIVYRISRKFFLTAGLTKKIQHRISIFYPSTKYSIIKRTQNYLIKVYMASLIAAAGLLAFAEISVYYSFLAAMVVYVMADAYINTELGRQEVKLLCMFEEFISEVHFNYQFDEMLLEAIEKASEKMPYEIGVHGEILLTYLKSAYLGKGDDYREICPNKLFLTFYSLSLTVLTYGDKKIDGHSVYLSNLGYLKEDINAEVLKRKKLYSQFMGLSTVIILPVFFIKIIEWWSVSNMPDLYGYYKSLRGIVITILLVFITISIYKIISMLKNPYNDREYKSKWAKYMLDNIYWINKSVLFIIKKTYKAAERLNHILKSLVYPYNIKEFILRRLVFSISAFLLSFALCLSVGMGVLLSVMVSAVSGAIFYASVYIKIIVKRQIMIMDSEAEIVRFQSVILMLMHMDKITVEEILRQISDFAVIFKEHTERMINKFSYLGMRVFEEEKENTEFMPFKKLMDSFLAADMLGIEKAFHGMESERRYYVEKHKQENEDIIMKKSVIAKGLAFVPICLIIMVKLILPFVMEGMKQLSNTGL
ncbi:MAG: hypothetical protein ACLRVQ_08720 [Lachnospiraceae bacterium]